MVEKEYLLAALADLGYQYREGNLSITGPGQTQRVEIVVPTSYPGYDIGFVKDHGSYQIVARWWGIRSMDEKSFVGRLTQRYAYHATKASLQREGFDLVAEESEVGGRVHLVLRRVA
jgi:hypothetical protein